MGLRTSWERRKEEEDRKRVGRDVFIKQNPNRTEHDHRRTVTSSDTLVMSVRIFPPSDEKHDDFEFDLEKFMGKWSVVVSFVVQEYS